jgi:hypothetical protein
MFHVKHSSTFWSALRLLLQAITGALVCYRGKQTGALLLDSKRQTRKSGHQTGVLRNFSLYFP